MLKTEMEHIWAKNKYEIMMKGYHHYKKIQGRLSGAETPRDFEAIYSEIELLKKMPFQHAAVITTLEHLWGYFKKQADSCDKGCFFTLLGRCCHITSELYEQFPFEVKSVLSFLAWLLDKHPRPYLEQSTLFLPDSSQE